MYYIKRHNLKYQLVRIKNNILFLDKVTKEDESKNLKVQNCKFYSCLNKPYIKIRSLNHKEIIINLPKYQISERALLLFFNNF